MSWRRFWMCALAALGGLALAALAAPEACAQVGTISTIAGGGPNNLPKLDANLNGAFHVAFDSHGNMYLAAYSDNRVYEIDSTGTLTIFAGNQESSFSGDGGPATQATLSMPSDVAVDINNNVYIVDTGDNLIRKVDAITHNISIVAGNYAGTICGTATDVIGDGCPATSATLRDPLALAFDGAGNIYIADGTDYVVREVSAATGMIQTVAGIPRQAGFGGDGGPATSAHLDIVYDVSVDSMNNIYLVDPILGEIRKVLAATGFIQVVAGNGTLGYNGDNIPATEAELNYPSGVFVDSHGNILIADSSNSRIRIVGGPSSAMPGYIQTLAGNGTIGFSGDNGPATAAALAYPISMIEDGSGNVFIVDNANARVREVYCTEPAIACTPPAGTAAGEIQTIAGNGFGVYSGDGFPATDAAVGQPVSVAADSNGNFYLSDFDDEVIRKVNGTTGIISTIGGNATLGCGNSGDGGPATLAQLCSPYGIFVDGFRNVFISDTYEDVVREIVAATGDIQTVAGVGPSGSPCAAATDNIGDGCPATSATLNYPGLTFADPAGNLIIADSQNNVVREVFAATGIIETIAGTPGSAGFGGDEGPATLALLSQPFGVFEDSAGNIYIADTGNGVIREVQGPSGASPGTIQTVAGQPGVFGNTGDGGPATMATLGGPIDVKVDAAGDLFISDCGEILEEPCNNTVREVMAGTGIIQTVAGNGMLGYNGDGEPATSAEFSYVEGIGVDPAGNLLIADPGNGRVRSVLGIASNTAAGMSQTVTPLDTTTGTTPISLTFSNVTAAGTTTLTTGSSGPPGPMSFQLGTPPVYYNLSTTASYTGMITVCVNYTGISFASGTPSLWHYSGGAWVNITTSVNTATMVVCGTTTSLSPFALFQPVPPPCATNQTASLSIAHSGFSYSPVLKRWAQTLTLTNTTSSAIPGPMYLVLDNLSSNAAVYKPAGTTTCAAPLGSPYVSMSAPLGGGASTKVSVQFIDPTNTGISYTPRVLAGPGSP